MPRDAQCQAQISFGSTGILYDWHPLSWQQKFVLPCLQKNISGTNLCSATHVINKSFPLVVSLLIHIHPLLPPPRPPQLRGAKEVGTSTFLVPAHVWAIFLQAISTYSNMILHEFEGDNCINMSLSTGCRAISADMVSGAAFPLLLHWLLNCRTVSLSFSHSLLLPVVLFFVVFFFFLHFNCVIAQVSPVWLLGSVLAKGGSVGACWKWLY